MDIILTGLLLLLAVAMYFRNLREAGWLLVLRLLVVLLLAAILLNRTLSFHWRVKPGKVAVLIDRSLSMVHGRADILAVAAARRFPVPAGLATEWWEFADGVWRTRSLRAEPVATGDTAGNRRTRLGPALATIIRTRPAAVVVVSDGQDNGELSPVQVARNSGVPIYTVGCGVTGLRNVEVTGLQVPPVVYAGDTFTVTGRIRYSGFRSEPATARVGQKVIALTLGEETAEQECSFTLTAEGIGYQLVRFQVDTLPDEFAYADNYAETGVEVLPGRIRLAYVTNRPSPQTRFVTDVIRREPRMELAQVVTQPTGSSSVAEADVYVLDNVNEPDWSTAQRDLQYLVHKVENGAGALILAGPDFFPVQLLRELLPSGAGVNRKQGSFLPQLAEAGRVYSWLAGIRFERLPPFGELFEPVINGQTEVWVTTSENVLPVIMAYRVGKGRVVYVAGHPLWRWGFGADIQSRNESQLSMFIVGAVRYLAERERQLFRMVTDKSTYLRGEPVRVTLHALTPDGSAWVGLDANLWVDSIRQLPMRERAAGAYEANVAALVPGYHTLRAEVFLGDSLVGTAAVSFAVSARELELSRLGLDRQMLVALAEASGGQYFRWDSLPPEGFALAQASYRRSLAFEPRRSFWVYGLVAVLLGAELVLRRKRGLL